MPVISMFYGIIIRMYAYDTHEHKHPHIHVQFAEQSAVLRIPDGEVLAGSLKPAKLKLVLAWLEIHQEEVMADWKLAASGEQVFQIEPLR